MNIFERVQDFIDSKDLEVHIVKNKVYLVNYTEISDFNNNKISVKHQSGVVDIVGKNLVITKLLNNELLVCGEIKNIELR